MPRLAVVLASLVACACCSKRAPLERTVLRVAQTAEGLEIGLPCARVAVTARALLEQEARTEVPEGIALNRQEQESKVLFEAAWGPRMEQWILGLAARPVDSCLLSVERTTRIGRTLVRDKVRLTAVEVQVVRELDTEAGDRLLRDLRAASKRL